MDYTHEFVEDLKIKAWKYCEANVYGFDDLSYEETQEYLEKTLKLLLENEAFSKKVFSSMLN